MSNPQQMAQLSAKASEKLGLPDGFKVFSPSGDEGTFGGLDQQASRPFIPDKDFFWLENYIRIGNGNLRTVWDRGPALFAATGGLKIVYYYFFNIVQVYYAAVFFSDGTASAINTATGAATVISATPGTFYNGGQLPACCQSGSQYLIISNNITANSYWIWDGTLLYTAGTLAPQIVITDGGSGYSNPPTVTAVGGSGSGATFVATIADGSVTSVTLTNPGTGYQPGDQIQLIFSGGGADTSAQLTAVLTSGTIGAADVTSGGTGYTSPPAVAFSGGGGTGAAGTAVLGALGVGAIAVSAGGTGYTSPPNVVITGGGGTGATATAALTGTAVSSITVNSPGTGYTTLPTVSFTGGGGSGAGAVVTFLSGPVTGITITAPGSGYTSTPTITLTGGGGTGATAVALLSAGSVASITIVNGGSGYTSTPTLTIAGGGGTGATATATVTSGAITAVAVTNAGSGYTSVPAVIVQNAVNTAASGTAELMPFGVSGTSIETFSGYVWLTFPFQQGAQVNSGKFLVSAPGSLTDFSIGDGGVIFTNSDRFLRAQYTAFRQAKGYLYVLGDSSAAVISSVTTSGNPSLTTFSYQNVDPQVGTFWRDTVQDFGSTILFANPLGIYGIYGGSATKASAKVDKLFSNAVLPAAGGITPCGAVASIFNLKTYLLLLTITDPNTNLPRTVMLGWDEKDWFIITQSSPLTFIATQQINSNLLAWGTDGTSLFQMMAQPSALIAKTFRTKLFGAQQQYVIKRSLIAYMQASDQSTGQGGLQFNVSIDTAGLPAVTLGGVTEPPPFAPSGSYPVPSPLFSAPLGTWPLLAVPADTGVPGINLGLTTISNSPDFAVANVMLGYYDETAVYG